MTQPKYLEQLRTLGPALSIEYQGWGFSGPRQYSPTIIQSWIDEGLIVVEKGKGKLTELGNYWKGK